MTGGARIVGFLQTPRHNSDAASSIRDIPGLAGQECQRAPIVENMTRTAGLDLIATATSRRGVMCCRMPQRAAQA